MTPPRNRPAPRRPIRTPFVEQVRAVVDNLLKINACISGSNHELLALEIEALKRAVREAEGR